MNSKHDSDEIVIFCDDRKRTWQGISQALQSNHHRSVKLSAGTSVRQCWSRFQKSPWILIHWESQVQMRGAIIEQILEISANPNIVDRMIIITNEPSREDIIYFSELGIRKIVHMPDNAMQAGAGVKELQRLLAGDSGSSDQSAWKTLQRRIDELNSEAEAADIKHLKDQLESTATDKDRCGARYFDLSAWLAFKAGRDQEAEAFWQKAVEINPNYTRSFHGLVELYCSRKDYRRAIDIIQNLQHRNKRNVFRLVKMGEIYNLMADELKSEHYFELALEKDSNCSGALNGLANLRFKQGRLEDARALLEKSKFAYKLAVSLNEEGIALVKLGHYEAALDHYSKAQYVLPQYQKGPMLLYNIGLCYSRWGKYQMAEQFLGLALAKDPQYDKAARLLEQVRLKTVSSVPCQT